MLSIMDFYSFVCFIYYFFLLFLANSLSFLVAKLLDEEDGKGKKTRFGDEDHNVSILTNSLSIFQDAEDDDEFEDAPLGKWVPKSSIFAGSADFICQSRVPDGSDEEIEDDDVESLISVSPTPSLPQPPPMKKRDLRSDPFLFKRKKTFVDRMRALFCCCGCAKPPDRYYFL